MLVLEDMSLEWDNSNADYYHYHQGLSRAQVLDAVRAIAEFHAEWWNHPRLLTTATTTTTSSASSSSSSSPSPSPSPPDSWIPRINDEAIKRGMAATNSPAVGGDGGYTKEMMLEQYEKAKIWSFVNFFIGMSSIDFPRMTPATAATAAAEEEEGGAGAVYYISPKWKRILNSLIMARPGRSDADTTALLKRLHLVSDNNNSSSSNNNNNQYRCIVI